MSQILDLESLLAPIPGADPAGEELYYTAVYDEIKEARRADADVPLGEWEREVKSSDWGKVIETATAALNGRSKDLQLAIWLTEALTVTRGFTGIDAGMQLIRALLRDFWDELYPRIEDDDYDYRVAPLLFLNDKISACVRQIPLTDPRQTPGYGLVEWQQSRKVGYESEGKREQRQALISDGHLAAEEFDQAVNKSSAPFYKALAESIMSALESFRSLDAEVDARFGRHAPALSTLGDTLEECSRLVLKICREQKGLREALEGGDGGKAAEEAPATTSEAEIAAAAIAETLRQAAPAAAPSPLVAAAVAGGGDSGESALWNEALAVMQGRCFKEALSLLLAAASSQSSERGRSRCRFLVAKLCLKGGRPELARPIVEQLNTMIAELQLEKWECPFWISEIYEALYQCLLAGEGYEEDTARANELFRKICTMDVTKALNSRV